MGRLRGKVAIVTGAGQGRGLGIAQAFANEGASLVITGRAAEKLEGVKPDLEARGANVVVSAGGGAKRENAAARWVHVGGADDCLRVSAGTFRVPSFLGRDHLGLRFTPREIASDRPSVSDVLASSCRAITWPNE